MSWTPTDEQVEKGAAAMHPRAFSRDAQWISDESRDRALNEMRREARAVLVAVGPHIAAQALRDYADYIDASRRDLADMMTQADDDEAERQASATRARADQIEKGAGR